MTSLREELAALAALTQLHLLQQYDRKQWLMADPETYQYFKKQVQNQTQAQKAKPPTPQPQPPPSAPIKPSPPVAAPQPVKTPPPPAAPPEPPRAALQEEKRISEPKAFFTREPLPCATPVPLEDMRSLVRDNFPGVRILDHLPEVAPNTLLPALPTIAILTFQEMGEHRQFLLAMAQGIQRVLAPTELIDALELERQRVWDRVLKAPQLKLIIASAHGMQCCPELMKHYREVNRTGKVSFGKVPALLLADLSVYLKEPHLKTALWRSIKEIMT